MATAIRALWKGAISFGLVHIPVSLHPAASESGIDFDWLDKRSMDPVGYKRVNKRTGRDAPARAARARISRIGFTGPSSFAARPLRPSTSNMSSGCGSASPRANSCHTRSGPR